jgi:hypothetical protein
VRERERERESGAQPGFVSGQGANGGDGGVTHPLCGLSLSLSLAGITRTLLWENKQLESSVRSARRQLDEALRPEAVLQAWHACGLDDTAARHSVREEFRGVVESVGLLHTSLEANVGAEAALHGKLTENIRAMRGMCNSMAQFPAQLPPLQVCRPLSHPLFKFRSGDFIEISMS